MRRSLFVLSLLAAFSATPLRLVEAAHDLACTIAELDDGSVIEPTDGGVGDDSDATIKANPTDAPMALPVAAVSPRDLFPVAPASQILRRPADPPPRPPSSHVRRLAMLQCFLI